VYRRVAAGTRESRSQGPATSCSVLERTESTCFVLLGKASPDVSQFAVSVKTAGHTQQKRRTYA
jgi:hypothetical protein